jgi:hypothetical protein
MFVVIYDLSDMPPSHRTFLRQRTMYVPIAANSNTNTSTTSNNNALNSCLSTTTTTTTKPVNIQNNSRKKKCSKEEKQGGEEDDEHSIELKSYLRYLIHLRYFNFNFLILKLSYYSSVCLFFFLLDLQPRNQVKCFCIPT